VLDWGASAVAVVELHDDNLFLAKYRDRAAEYHHLVALWEGDRRIDTVCAGVEIVSNGA
jgi:hypothetical protein